MYWWIFLFVAIAGPALFMGVKLIGGITKVFLDLQIQLPYEEGPDLPGERVLFDTKDGVSLPGQFIKSPASDGRTVLFAPEFGADLGSYRKYADHLVEAGFHLFAFEFRGHGPVHVSKGYIPTHWPTRYELHDIQGAIDFVSAQKGVDPDKLALFGVSKGGCLAICAASKNPRVKAVVTDSAFSTRSTSIMYMERWGPIFVRSELFWRWVPKWYLATLQRVSMFISGLLRGCHFISVSDYLKNWPGTPLFLIHGERDSLVPCEQVSELVGFVSEGEPATWIVSKARHNESVLVAPEEYKRRTVEFLNQNLPGDE